MTAILMYLKQPNLVFSTCLWLMTLSVVNAEVLNNEQGRLFLSPMQRKARSLATKPIEVAALGRPLYPGMLYDSRQDTFITGVTLWDKKSLSEDLDSRSQVQTDLKFSSSDSVSSKSKLLDVSASLKASFLGGLVEVGGSAKYLSDSKSSNQQSRVTMFYSETSRFEQLSMTHLGKITYPQVFDQKTATHVVSAVLYGAQAFMVFDRTFSDHEDKQVIEGELNVMVKKIHSFSLEGAVKMNDSEKEMAEQISCKFYGDFHLEQNPTTYLEAVEIYKKLPSMLKENPQNVVPLKVWLYPLSLLDAKAARLERELSSSQVANIGDIVEDLGEVERLLNDLFTNPIVGVFREIRDRLNSFKSSFHLYKTLLLKAVARILPAIRGGEKDGQALEEIVRIHNDSPFNVKHLKQWLEDAESEIHFLSLNVKTLDGIKIEDTNGFNKILFNPDVDVVVSLTFTSLQYEDQYLSTLKECLKSDQFKETSEKKIFPVQPQKKWFKDQDVLIKMREVLSRFKSFSVANKKTDRMSFAITSISDTASPGSSIFLYEHGKLTNKAFQPVSKPLPPVVEQVLHQAISLKLQKSSSADTIHYRVEYKPVTADTMKDDRWFISDSSREKVTLTGLESEKPYLVRYRTVGRVGVSEASESVSVKPLKTQPVTVGEGEGAQSSFMTSSLTKFKKIKMFYLELDSPIIGRKILEIQEIQVTFINGQTLKVGLVKESASAHIRETEFVFDDDDKLIAATLWPGENNKHVGGLEFVVKKKDGSTKTFSFKQSQMGSPKRVDVKSGRCYGLTAKAGGPLASLGFYFS